MSSVLDPGKKARNAASSMAREGQINNIFADGGLFGGGSFSDGSFTSNLGGFGGMAGDIMSQLQGGLGGDSSFTDLLGFGQDAMGGLGPIQRTPEDAALMQNLRGTAMNQFGILQQDPSQIGAQRTDILRQLAAPGEQQSRVGLGDNLFAQGRLGSTGGAQQAQALAAAQGQADLQRQLAGQDFGRQVQADALGRLQGSLGQMEALRTGQLGRDLSFGQAQGQRALDRFGIAGNLFDAARINRLSPYETMGAGLGALGQIQGFGLNQFNTGLNAEIARSNAALGGSNAMANVAASTPNIFGSLASGVFGAAGQAGGFGSLFGGGK